MSTVPSQVSKYMGNAVSLANIWGTLIYNVMAIPYLAKGDNSHTDTTNIQQAITSAAVNGGVVAFPPGTYKTGSFTVPSNVTLWFMNGAKLSIDSGATVTINGPIDTGLYQIFSGLGTVAGVPKITRYYPEWFGAAGDKVTDDTQAVQKCIDFAYLGSVNKLTIVRMTQFHMVSSTINQPQGVMINMYGGGLKAKDTTLNPVLRVYNKNAPAAPFNELFDVFGGVIEGDNNTSRGVAKGVSIDTNFHGGSLCSFRDCTIKNFILGVELNNGNRMIVFDNCKITTKTYGIRILSTAGGFTGDHWIKACQIECETGTCIDMVCNNAGSQLAGIHVNGGCVLYALTGVSCVTDASGAKIADIFMDEMVIDGRGTGTLITITGGNSLTFLINNLWANAADYGIVVTSASNVIISNSKISSLNLASVYLNNTTYCSVVDSTFHDCNKIQNGGGVIALKGTTTKAKVRGNSIFNSKAVTDIPIVAESATTKCIINDNITDTTNVFLNQGTGSVAVNNIGA